MKNLIFKYKDKIITQNDKTLICGILNVTPDSFSDGGKFYNKEDAIKGGLELAEQGAHMIDIGGESTRPGSHYVQIEDEINRIVPVVKELKEKTNCIISVDTWKSQVAKAAIEAGADIINDITGFLGDPKMAEVVGNSDAGAILMFNPVIGRPEHEGSKIFPTFGGEGAFTPEELKENTDLPIIEFMDKFFQKSLARASAAGISKERIMLDPGIGFGLTKKENLILIKEIDVLKKMGHLTFLGVSRKRFIQNILGENGFNNDIKTDEGFSNRDIASSYISVIAALSDVSVIRVHSIKEHKMALAIASAIKYAEEEDNINFSAYKN